MATIDTSGRPAFMYDEDTETWYAISGRVSTSANYVWTGAQQFTNNVRIDGALTATLRINSFLNPAARTAAIAAPGVGLITFLQQDAGGNTINRFEFWNGSAWIPLADQSSVQTLTNKTLSSPVISGTASGTYTDNSVITLGGSISGGTINNSLLQSTILRSPEERTTVSASASTGTINYDCLTQAVLYYTANATANWTLNFRGNSSTTLNSSLETGDSISVIFLAKQGATPYYPTVFQVDGSAVTPLWAGGSAPSAGNANSVDGYSFNIVKTANATFTVFAGSTGFA
jgi:hypothetical protein